MTPADTSRPISPARSLAVVDIGTNTLKYSVFEVTDGAPPQLLASGAETVRLGADIDLTGMIGDER